MSVFWSTRKGEGIVSDDPSFTFMLVHDAESDAIKKVALELLDDPLKGLSFSDFSLSECIRHGISYKSLGITPDMRNGYDSEFELLESRFDDLSKDIFVKSENN